MRPIALTLVMAAALFGAGTAKARPPLYIASSHGYSAAFKVEHGHPYVIALDALMYCRATGSHPIGQVRPSTLEMFPKPVWMEPTREGFRGEDEEGPAISPTRAVVTARFNHGTIVGYFRMVRYVEPGAICHTGGRDGSPKVRFKAVRYLPVGASGERGPPAARPARAVYFTSAERVEVYLRRFGRQIVQIRGAASQRCSLPASESQPPRVPLFSLVTSAVIGEGGGFQEHWRQYGLGRKHTTYVETEVLTGRIRSRVVSGRYLRIKAKKRDGTLVRRCETDPVRFRAVRYVRVR